MTIVFYHLYLTNTWKTILHSHNKALSETYKNVNLHINDVEESQGEFETILEMLFYLQANKYPVSDDTDVLFLHSKGVTDPPTDRSQMEAYGAETNEDITKNICEFIRRGKPEFKDFYYHIWNIFWANAGFLRKFNLETYLENQGKAFPPDQKYYPLKDRHVFSLFPIKLWGILNDKVIDIPRKELINLNEDTINNKI